MMKITEFQQKITGLFPKMDVRFNESMANHTSFRIGGPAEVVILPKNREELGEILQKLQEIGVTPRILGAGTNVLAPDDGIQGVVLILKENFGGVELLDETHLQVSAGITMTRAAVFAATKNLSGMEFAHGIPGTVGGGVYMNAGAYGGEIKDICESVDVMFMDGAIVTIPAEEMHFGYRHSRLEEEDGIVLSAVFRLTPKPEAEIRSYMQELMTKRKTSQPLDLPSAGSAFKRPVGGYAAALIDQAGLKGYRVGGAAVSEKHAGFAVNLGGATAEDVKKLLKQVSDIVFEKSGIRLEPEVRIW